MRKMKKKSQDVPRVSSLPAHGEVEVKSRLKLHWIHNLSPIDGAV